MDDCHKVSSYAKYVYSSIRSVYVREYERSFERCVYSHVYSYMCALINVKVKWYNSVVESVEISIANVSHRFNKTKKMKCIFCQGLLFTGGHELKVAKCGHIFHIECFEHALKM